MPKKKVTTRKAAEGLAKRTGAVIKKAPSEPKSPFKQPRTAENVQPITLEPPSPPPTPAPIPAPVLDQSQVVAAIEGASANTQKVLLDLARQIEEIRQQMADRPTEWIFDWEYLNNGRIKRIKASVPDIKKLLN